MLEVEYLPDIECLTLKNEPRKKTLRILFKVMDDFCFYMNLLGNRVSLIKKQLEYQEKYV